MNNNDIPNHLIFEYILPKLLVKSLLGFKSVSKSWLSTISSPEFAKTHLQSSSSSMDDYKILGLFSSFRTGSHFYVFSLSTGNWVRFGVLDNIVQSLEFNEVEAVLIDKSIYISFASELEDTVVYGFDLITQQIKQLPWIDWVDKYSSVRLSELRGCLLWLCRRNVLNVDYIREDDVWMLKDPNDMNSWEKLFSISLSNVLHYGFCDNGKCFLHTKEKFVIFDPTRETPHMAQGGIAFDFYDTIIQSKSYVESLVSPFR